MQYYWAKHQNPYHSVRAAKFSLAGLCLPHILSVNKSPALPSPLHFSQE